METEKSIETKERKRYFVKKIREATLSAFKDGTLQAQPCKVCGKMESGPYHHDYNKPFNIIWLCEEHKNHVYFKKKFGRECKPHKLLDYIKEIANAVSDVELGEILGMNQSKICAYRSGRVKIGKSFLFDVMQKLRIPMEDLEKLIEE